MSMSLSFLFLFFFFTDNSEELTVFTASDDGTVQLWKPLEVGLLSQLHSNNFQISSFSVHVHISCPIQTGLVLVLIQSILLAFVQVENLNTFQGHSGTVCGLVCKEGVPEFLTVSEDCSLRCWTWETGTPYICTPTYIYSSDTDFTVSMFTVIVNVLCLFRGYSCTQGWCFCSVLLSTGWCASRWLWIWVDGDLAAQLYSWPQAGDDSHQCKINA